MRGPHWPYDRTRMSVVDRTGDGGEFRRHHPVRSLHPSLVIYVDNVVYSGASGASHGSVVVVVPPPGSWPMTMVTVEPAARWVPTGGSCVMTLPLGTESLAAVSFLTWNPAPWRAAVAWASVWPSTLGMSLAFLPDEMN